MAGLDQVIVNWIGPGHSPKVSIFFSDADGDVAAFRNNLSVMLNAIAAYQSNQYSFRIDTSGDTFDEASGALIGSWTDSTLQSGTGLYSGQPMPDAAQVLLRWTTGQIVNGRRLRGRTYVPGIAMDTTVNGNLNDGTVAIMSGLANDFVDSTTPPRIWHRPTGGTGGVATAATGASCWSEFAVLRRRRG